MNNTYFIAKKWISLKFQKNCEFLQPVIATIFFPKEQKAFIP